MTRQGISIVLPILALSAALLGESGRARQGEAEDSFAGVIIEPLGRAVVGNGGEELVMLRITIEPGASIPASDGPYASVILLEEGRVGIALQPTEAEVNLTLAGSNATVPLTAGAETILAPGDTVSSGERARLALRNTGDSEAILLFTAVARAGDFDFAASSQDASGTFSVETFTCPEGMTLATLETETCQPSDEPLVQWSLASDQFDAPLDADEATVTGATTTWRGLPSGTYFIDLSAESFAPGYGDYFIPSSNQVTRQDERTTHIYHDATQSRGSIDAYVFAGDPAGP
jgi:quercetin dioxygenase-like cupin family protein